MTRLHLLLSPRWWSFQWRYWRGRTPWDTQRTPPEVLDFIRASRPGRALDIGCGTGTNAIALAKAGWQVTAIDFAVQAIVRARRKASARNVHVDFQWGDVTHVKAKADAFDYALDIGCLHALEEAKQRACASELKRVVRPGGTYMLYAWLPRDWRGKQRGLATESVLSLFNPAFHLSKHVIGEEKGAPSAWYWFVRA